MRRIRYRRQLLITLSLFIQAPAGTSAQEQHWGISAITRQASVPYEIAGHSGPVSSFIPGLHVDNRYFFLDGLAGGIYLHHPEQSPWSLSALVRFRFVDHPDSGENGIEDDATDFGAQLRYQLSERWRTELEFMSDKEDRHHANLRIKARYETESLRLEPAFTVRYKDADFNSAYYALSGVTGEQTDAGTDTTLALNVRYHVFSSLYLLGGVSLTRLDSQAYHSDIINHRYQNTYHLGFGFLKIKPDPTGKL